MAKSRSRSGPLVTLLVLLAFLLTSVASAQEDYDSQVKAAVLKADWAKVGEITRAWKGADASAVVADWLLGYAGLGTGDYKTATEGFSRLSQPQTTDRLLTWADALTKQNPSSAPAQMLVGDARARAGNHGQALNALDEAVRLAPRSAMLYDVRGIIRALAGRTDAATEDFDKAVSLQTNFADPYLGLGLVRLGRGDTDGAVEDFGRAVELAPEFALAYNARAVALASAENWSQSEEDLRKASKLAPSWATVIANLQLVKKEVAWHVGRESALREIASLSGSKRGMSLAAMSYEHRTVDLGGGRSMDVFVVKPTDETTTLAGMNKVVREITDVVRGERDLSSDQRLRCHMDAHGGLGGGPYAEHLRYAARTGLEAGADAVIALDMRTLYGPGGTRATDESARFLATANAAVNRQMGEAPTFSGFSLGAAAWVKTGNVGLPREIEQGNRWSSVALHACPFSERTEVPSDLAQRVEGNISNFHTTRRQLSSVLHGEKIQNFEVTDVGGAPIPHGAWNDDRWRGGRLNPIPDVNGVALRNLPGDVVRASVAEWCQEGHVPDYWVPRDSQKTAAIAMSSMTDRGLALPPEVGPRHVVVAGVGQDGNGREMIRFLEQRGWKVTPTEITDRGALQRMAADIGAHRIVGVGGAGDGVSRQVLSAYAKSPPPPSVIRAPLLGEGKSTMLWGDLPPLKAYYEPPSELQIKAPDQTKVTYDRAVTPSAAGMVMELVNLGVGIAGATKPTPDTLGPLDDAKMRGGLDWYEGSLRLKVLQGGTFALMRFDPCRNPEYGRNLGVSVDLSDPRNWQLVPRDNAARILDAQLYYQQQTSGGTDASYRRLFMGITGMDWHPGLAQGELPKVVVGWPTAKEPGSTAALTSPQVSERRNSSEGEAPWSRRTHPFFPPDKFGGAGVPKVDYNPRLPPGAVPGPEKVGGVAMKTDVVKNGRADMAEVFGGDTAPQPVGSQRNALLCPFLLFCETPTEK